MGLYLTGYQGNFNPGQPAVIADGQTASAAISLNGFVLCGIQVPAAFTGTAVSFQASVDGMTYQALHSTTSGTALSYTTAQGQFCAIDPKDFHGVNFLKIVSNASEGAARTLLCALKGF